jgi:hypothetical protein
VLQREGETLYRFGQFVYTLVLPFVMLAYVLDVRLALLHITGKGKHLLAEVNDLLQHGLLCCSECVELNTKARKKRIGVRGDNPGLGLEAIYLHLLLLDVGAYLLEFRQSLRQYILRIDFNLRCGRR